MSGLCPYSGLGLMGRSDEIPNKRDFPARCACGAVVTVVDGRIPFHSPGEDERPFEESFEEEPQKEQP